MSHYYYCIYIVKRIPKFPITIDVVGRIFLGPYNIVCHARIKIPPDILRALGFSLEEQYHLFISPDNTALVRRMGDCCDVCGEKTQTKMILGRNVCPDCMVMKLQEYRMSVGGINQKLKHITVLEEAHNLLRRTSTEQTQESSNLQGKSVEMLANAITEMRTYGEGFIIADQSPGLMRS